MITIKVNNITETVPAGTTAAKLLVMKGLTPGAGAAMAINGKVVPAVELQRTDLHEGDSLIIIKAAYGG